MNLRFPLYTLEWDGRLLLLLGKNLSDLLNVFELVQERIASLTLADEVFLPKFVSLCLGEPHEILLFKACFLSETLFDLFCDVSAHSFLSSFVIVFQIIPIFPHKERFFTLLLNLLSAFLFVFFWENGCHLRSHILSFAFSLSLLSLFDFHKSLRLWLVSESILVTFLLISVLILFYLVFVRWVLFDCLTTLGFLFIFKMTFSSWALQLRLHIHNIRILQQSILLVLQFFLNWA